MKPRYFLKKIHLKKGALHDQLGIPESQKIRIDELKRIIRADNGDLVRIRRHNVRVTGLMTRRAALALTLRKF